MNKNLSVYFPMYKVRIRFRMPRYRSLSYSRAVLWNSLPLDIRQSPFLNEFKLRLKNYDLNSSLM